MLSEITAGSFTSATPGSAATARRAAVARNLRIGCSIRGGADKPGSIIQQRSPPDVEKPPPLPKGAYATTWFCRRLLMCDLDLRAPAVGEITFPVPYQPSALLALP